MTPLIHILLGTAFLCGTHSDASRVRVGLYADFQYESSSEIREAIQDELAAIMVPIGPALTWRALAENRGDERWTTLVVVHFRGRCDLSDLTAYPPYPWILGRTHVSDGEVIPFSEIYCSAIRAFLAPALVSSDPKRRGFMFGRAIGRVLAKTKHHASGGLGEASYTPEELAADDFSFQDRDVNRIRATLSPMLVGLAGTRDADRCPASGQ